MILRKPYAFLMKHFRKINLVLLLLAIFIFISTLTLQGYASSYVKADTSVVDLIVSLLSPLYFFVLILILLITFILFYLLRRKDKPVKTYIFIFIEYIAMFILGIYLHGYFADFLIHGYDLAMARATQGIIRVFMIPQYVVLLLLVIRTIGIDLKSFGFKHDQEFLTNEEDREEVEVEVEFDPDKFKREVRKHFRNISYFVKEHKVQVGIVLSAVLLIISFFTYRHFYVINRVYKMRDEVSSNSYTFSVQNSYITTKDYRGDIVNKGKSYVILDLDITNEVSAVRGFDIQKFILYVDDDYYVPTVNYNQSFSDLGNVYKGVNMLPNESVNYFLIYEINTPKENSSFLLKYQDVSNKSRLLRVKLQIKDISNTVLKEVKNMPNEMSIPVNEKDTLDFSIKSFEIGFGFTYSYERCLVNDCPVYTSYTNPGAGRRILYMRVNPLSGTTQNLIHNFVKYGKMRYVINGTTYSEKLVNHINYLYKGNYLYIDVSDKILDATSIEMVFTIRNNQYVYVIK